MGDAIPLEAMAYAEEGALDGGAIILVPQEDVQSVLLGESLLGGGGMEGGPSHQLVLGQLQPLHLEGSPHHMTTGPLVFAPVAHHHHQGGEEEEEEDITMTTLSPACLSPSLVEQQQAAECSPLAAHHHHHQPQPQQQQQPSGPPPSSPAAAAPPERTVSRALKVRWLDELLASKGIRCPIPDCPTVCTSITAMQKHYAHCPGVNGSGLDQCPYCEAQFLSKSSALHVHVVEVHPTRRSLMHSTFEGTPRKPLPYRRRCPEDGPSARSLGRGRGRGRGAAAAGGPPAAKRAAMGGRTPGPYPSRGAAAANRTPASGGLLPASAGAAAGLSASTPGGAPQAGGAGGQWDWEQKRRTYSRSWGEPTGPTSELFRRGAGGGGGADEEDPLQLPRSVLNRSGVTLSSEELALNEHQLQEGSAATASGEPGELCGGDSLELETPTPETIRLDSLPNILRKGSGRGAGSRRFLRNRYRGDNVRTMQVIVKSGPGTEGASALLRNPRVLQTLGDLAVNAAAAAAGGGSPVAGLLTSTSVQPLSPHPQPQQLPEEDEANDQAVVAVHSAATPDGRYLQVEQALKPTAIRPSDVDRFFLKRVDCSCQTDDLPPPPPPPPPPAPAAVRPELPPGTIAPPAILKRTRLLAPAGHHPPTKGPGKPLAVSIVCSSHASSSDEDDDEASPAHAQQRSPPTQPPAPAEPLPTAQLPAEPSPEQPPPAPVQQLSPAAIQAAVEQALAGLQSGQPLMLQQLQAGQPQPQLPGSFVQAMVLPSLAGQLGGALQQQQQQHGVQVFAIQMPDGQGPAIAIMQTPELQQALGDMAGLAQLLAGAQPITVPTQASQLSSEGATPVPEPLSGPQATDQALMAQPETPLHPAPTQEAILPGPLTETVFPQPFPSQQEETHPVAVPPSQLSSAQALGNKPGALPTAPPPSQRKSLQEPQAGQLASGVEPLAPPAAPSQPVPSPQSMEQRPPTPPVVPPEPLPSQPQVPFVEPTVAQSPVRVHSGPPDSSLAAPLPTLRGVDERLGPEQGDVQLLPLVTSLPPAEAQIAQHPAEHLSQLAQQKEEQADAQKAAATEEPVDQEPAAHMVTGAWHTQEHQYASAHPAAQAASPDAPKEALDGTGMVPQVAEGAGIGGGEPMDQGEPTAPDGLPQAPPGSGLLFGMSEQTAPPASPREEQQGLTEQDPKGSDQHECAQVQLPEAAQGRAVEEEEPLGHSQEGVEQPEPTLALQQEPLKEQESSPEQVVPQQDGTIGSTSSDSCEGRGTVEGPETGLGGAVVGAPPGSSSQGSSVVSLEACEWPGVPAVAQEQCSDPMGLQSNTEPSGESAPTTEGGQAAHLELVVPPASALQGEGVEQGVSGATEHIRGAQVEQDEQREDSDLVQLADEDSRCAHLAPNTQGPVNEDGVASVAAPAVAMPTPEEPVDEAAAQVVPSLIREQDEGSEESVAPAALQHSVPLETDALEGQVVRPTLAEGRGSVEAGPSSAESSEGTQPPSMSADQISQRAQADAGSSQAHVMRVLVPSLDAPGMEGGLGDGGGSARETPQSRQCVPSGDVASFAAAAPNTTGEVRVPCRNEDSVIRPIEARLLLSMPEGVPCPDAQSRASLPEEADEGAQVVPECTGQNGRTTEETARPAASPQQTAARSGCEASPESAVASPAPQGVKKPPDDKLQVVPESARGDGTHTEPAAKRARHAEGNPENGQEEEDEEAMDVDDRPPAGQRDASSRDEIFMDDADSASSCEALHIVESVPEEEMTRGAGARAAGDESQEERADDGNVAGHFLVVSGGRRVAASTCAHIPVQLVLSRGPQQQLKRLACSITCRAVRRPPVRLDGGRPTLEFTIGLSSASARLAARVRSRSGAARVAARRQRARRFQLRVKSSLLPHQPARPPAGRRPSKRCFTIVLNGGGVGADLTPPREPGDNVEKPGDDPPTATGTTRQDGAGADQLGRTAREEPAVNSTAPRASELPSGSSSRGASSSGCPSGGNHPGQPEEGPNDAARLASSEPREVEEQEGEEEREEQGSQDVDQVPEEPLQGSRGVAERQGEAAEQQLQVPPARRRGRPPEGESASAAPEPSSGDSPPAPKKRRGGRPPRALSAKGGEQGPGTSNGAPRKEEHTACNGPQQDSTAQREEGPLSRPNKERGAAAASTDEALGKKAPPGRADSSRVQEEAAFSPARRSSGRKQPLANEGPLVCSACGQSFSRKEQASEHILLEHYNVALINSERSLSEQEVRTALRRATDVLGQLRCHSCGQAFQAYMSYYVHRGHCQPAATPEPKEPQGQQVGQLPDGGQEQRTPRPRLRKQELKTLETAARELEGGQEHKAQGPEGQERGTPGRRGRPLKLSDGQELKTPEGRGRQSKGRERQTPEPKTAQPRVKRCRGQEQETPEQGTPEPRGKQPKGQGSEGQEPKTLKGRRKQQSRDDERQTLEPETPQPRAKRLKGQEQETPDPGAKHPREDAQEKQQPDCRSEGAVPTEGKARRQTHSRGASSLTEAAATTPAYPGPEEEEAGEPFVCSACKEAFPDMPGAELHLLRAHYNLARVNDERPLSEEEVVTALSGLNRRVRRFDCAQPDCNHRSWRPVDFLKHLSECGPYVGVVTEATVKGFRLRDAVKKLRGHPRRAVGSSLLATPSPSGRQPKRTPLYKLNLDFPQGTPLVCSACRQSFTCKDAIAKHILEGHYNLARVNDERPLTLEEMRSALRLASFQVVRFACLEPECRASFASYMAYYAHLKGCGPFQQLFESDSEEEDEDEGEEPSRQTQQSNNTPASAASSTPASAGGRGRGRRSSALRALASFCKLDYATAADEAAPAWRGPSQDDSDFAPSHGEDEEEGEEGEEEEEGDCELAQEERGGGEERRASSKAVLERAWQGKFEGPRQGVRVDAQLVDSWNQALLHVASIPCPNKGCIKQFTTAMGLKYHYPRCMTHQLYHCLNCSGAFQRPRSLLEHLRRCYPERPEGDPVGEDLAPSCERRKRRKRAVAQPASLPVGPRQRQSASQACSTQRLPALLASARRPVVARLFQHMQHLQANVHSWQETLFPDWMPTGWRLLDEQEAEPRLPKFRESPCVRSVRFGTRGKGQQQPSWERLPLFGSSAPSASGGCHLTFYPGGAVWASAWCPMAPDPGGHRKPAAQSQARRQWVALACCPDPDLEHPLTETSSEPGLIQIWDLGTLHFKRGPGEEEGEEGPHGPRLALCLAHDYGFVTDLAWCPSGCWQEQQGRLGLLALACGDGYARILSIPFPDALGTPEGRWPLYSTDGQCSLRLRMPQGPLGPVPCTRVAWDLVKGHGRMAAGYADGRVGLFPLEAEPQQQQLAGTGEAEREACWTWQAHQAAVTGLGFTPQEHLATASLDHSTRIWDLERPGPVPLSSFSKGPVRHMALSPHWNGTFLVGEEILTNGPALSVFRENGYYGFPPKSLAAHGTTVLSVAVSPWTNAVASCDASGEVGAIVLPCLSQSLDLMKHHNHSRLPVYRTVLVALNEDEEDKQRPSGKKRPLARAGPPQHGGHSVASRDFGLCFEDVPLLRDVLVPQQALERVVNFKGMLSPASNQYRLASLNTVCWSPNLGAANWLLSAGQAGVARLSWLGLLTKRLLCKGNT